MRFDVVLNALHLYKSRSQARVAIQTGTVLLNGARVKPSHAVAPGDRITIGGARGARTLELLELPGPSLSKEAAKSKLREVAE